MKKFIYILLIIILLFGITGVGLAFWFYNGNLKEKIMQKAAGSIIKKFTVNQASINSSTVDNVSDIFKDALGFYEVKNYLILFLNNTELRPGGGFIGTYAIVKMDKGSPQIIHVDGTENLAVHYNKIASPKPIADFLTTQSLEFRDSNWWPDFASSTQMTLATYKSSNGVMADNIDAVIGFTPTVFEEILKLTGPFKYDGITFDSSNFTKELEYEVEYNFKNKGIAFKSRKQIMEGIMAEMVKKLVVDVFLRWANYTKLTVDMLAQKQLLFYSNDTYTQQIIDYKDMGGRVKQTNGDYLLWVDANLGALKTDAALKRELSYGFKAADKNKYLATVKMKYIHNGVFDWRTTRYRTYARIYAPLGSEYKQVSLNNLRGDKKVDQGQEFGKQWFGTFVSIEPQNTGELVWQFYLSKDIVAQIKKGEYSLNVQKQLGGIDNKLSLDLDFGRRLNFASPSEKTSDVGNNIYTLQTDLKVDRDFQVKMLK